MNAVSRVRVEGTSISFSIVGSGSPVMLIAGTGYPGCTWHPEVVDELATDHTVITFDHRGTGASPGTAGDYTTELFAADAIAVLEEVSSEEAVVIGHSMGGRVAQWVAHDRPDLLAGLVLAASGPGSPNQTDGIPIRTVLRLMDLGFERFIRDLQRRTFFTPEFLERDPTRAVWLGDAFWNGRPSLEDYLKHVVARQRHDSGAILSEIVPPTLVIVGDRDTHRGDTGSHVDQSRSLVERMPGATLSLLPGVTHGFFWEDPEPAVSVIRGWMQRLVH